MKIGPMGVIFTPFTPFSTSNTPIGGGRVKITPPFTPFPTHHREDSAAIFLSNLPGTGLTAGLGFANLIPVGPIDRAPLPGNHMNVSNALLFVLALLGGLSLAFVLLGVVSDILWPAIERMLTQDSEAYRKPQAIYLRRR